MKERWWDVHAGTVQAAVRQSAIDRDEDYSDREVRRATVYTREDMVLVAMHLSSLNRQIATLKWLVLCLVIIAAAMLTRYSFR